MRELVKAKAEGHDVATAEAPPDATKVLDLMKALEGSLKTARSRRGEEEEKSAAGQTKKAAPRKTARKAAAGKAAKPPWRKAPPKKAAVASTRSRNEGKRELQKLSKAELYQRATDLEVPGRSKMSREDLIDALARAGRRRKKSAA
ncbi:hypothetical protein ABT272_30925 [Streptomyces sp900105245]|uniref:Rho termination factor-like N-terminal domain-containing protein n=1 Tax=Streptomyces sp. 900105245 TaxID=3154379 RepID=A0ABV1UEG4_9ACTN